MNRYLVRCIAVVGALLMYAGAVPGVVISGSIRNVSRQDVPVPHLNAKLFELGARGARLVDSVVTDELGLYRFDNVTGAPGMLYGVQVVHSGVQQGSELFELIGDAVPMDIAVYDTTSSSAGISLDRVHVIFHPSGEMLGVTSMYIVNNSGAVYMGDPPGADGRRRVIRFLLPAGYTNLAIMQGGLAPPPHHIEEPWGIASVFPQYPGKDTVVFQYSVPWEGEYTYEQRSPYPMASVNAVGKIGIVGVEMEGGTQRPSAEMPDLVNYEATWIPPDTPVRVHVTGVGSVPGSASASSMPMFLGLLLLFIGAVAAVAVYVLQKERRRTAQSTPVSTDENVPEKPVVEDVVIPDSVDELVQAVARLDEDFETDSVSADVYVLRRRLLKARLVELLKAEE